MGLIMLSGAEWSGVEGPDLLCSVPDLHLLSALN